MLTFEQFESFYWKWGRCINDVYGQMRKRPLSEDQLREKYKKYVAVESRAIDQAIEDYRSFRREGKKKSSLPDPMWNAIRDDILARDGNECRYIAIAPYEDYTTIKIKGGSYSKIIDVAHVLGKAAYPRLKYEHANLVCLNRYSHDLLHRGRHPASGKPIGRVEINMIWIDILGTDQYSKLVTLLDRLEMGNPLTIR